MDFAEKRKDKKNKKDKVKPTIKHSKKIVFA